MKKILLLFAGVLVLMSSCVTNRKYQMLQKDDVNAKSKHLAKDSVLREYNLVSFDYKIQTNDILSVTVETLTPKEFDFFSTEASQINPNVNISQSALLIGELVDEKGEIALPVLGRIKVSGLTIFGVQEKIQALADQYVESPVVKVRLLNFRITLLGEVFREGTITLLNNRATLLEAIGQAGGLGELADRSNVKLIRQKGDTTEVVYLDLLREDFLYSPYYYVNQNDVLIVPPLKQRPFKKQFPSNLAMIVSAATLIFLAINLTQ